MRWRFSSHLPVKNQNSHRISLSKASCNVGKCESAARGMCFWKASAASPETTSLISCFSKLFRASTRERAIHESAQLCRNLSPFLCIFLVSSLCPAKCVRKLQFAKASQTSEVLTSSLQSKLKASSCRASTAKHMFLRIGSFTRNASTRRLSGSGGQGSK